MKDTMLLFCSNPLEPRHPDFDYASEYKQVQHSAFPQVLFDFDSFVSGNTTILPDMEQDKRMIYRGWMMKPETYCRFYHTLAEKQCFLINTPEQYCFCHTLPGWYDTFSDVTPRSRWTEDLSDHAIITQLQSFGNAPVIIKDYVKSRKHEWKEACFIPNAADTGQAMQVIHTFMERQGEDLVGGLVIREYFKVTSKNHYWAPLKTYIFAEIIAQKWLKCVIRFLKIGVFRGCHLKIIIFIADTGGV